MWGKRGLLPLAIFGIVAAVAFTYWERRQAQLRQRPVQPAVLPAGVGAAAQDWQWSRNIGDRPGVEIRARTFRHLQDPERIELEQVELRLHHADGTRFDQVRCGRAVFDPARAVLYSEGEVEFVMGLRPGGAHGRLVWIQTSGVTFDNRTGRASTERAARFRLEEGEGSAVGASYDPGSRELHLRSQVELNWRGRGPGSRPMRLQAGELIYKENDALILLLPWARLHRGDAAIDAADTIVVLREGSIRRIEARRARGRERRQGGLWSFAADHLYLDLTPEGELEKLTAEGEARVESATAAARTVATAARMDLLFEPRARATILRSALAAGNATLVTEPVPRPGSSLPDARRLASEVIQLEMRPGGEEIEQVRTETPGTLEFVPNRKGKPLRRVQAERLWINYGQANRVRSVRAVDVVTRTEPGSDAAQQPPIETRSRDLLALFDPAAGELVRLEQWNDFQYREGSREARAGRGVLDQVSAKLLLEQSARVWDAQGSIAAERIELDRATGDVIAEGRVRSTSRSRQKDRPSTIVSREENFEAQADRMQTFAGRSRVLYEGRVQLWQGSERLEADRVEIDRAARRLWAEGNLVSRFAERRPGAARPTLLTVRAGRLLYDESERMAHYSGGVRLRREELEIEAPELRAWFRQTGEETTLERALASGGVRLTHRSGRGARTGSAEMAEYFAPEERAVLNGGTPVVEDAAKGLARGRRISWRLRDDTLEVEGGPGQPALSRLRRQ